ncbi:MAG: hypothetical protein IKV89_02135 [Clostridia bacterium]|nr:hypothetical protein [Clostridia bacterium]
MELMKAIETADALCPNPYTLEEKLRWCHEVSSSLRREIKKIYDVIETSASPCGNTVIPDNIAFEDIEGAYLNGKYMNKLDFRNFAAGNITDCSLPGGRLKIVYLTHPEPVRDIVIKGKFDLTENFINMEDPPFIEGDYIQIAELKSEASEPDFESGKTFVVLDATYQGILVDGDSLEPATEAVLAIKRVIDDMTEIDEAPYDSMYVEYILAKMALYQRDFTGYNAHMVQYNQLFDCLRREYKNRAPLNPLASFKNYWNL